MQRRSLERETSCGRRNTTRRSYPPDEMVRSFFTNYCSGIRDTCFTPVVSNLFSPCGKRFQIHITRVTCQRSTNVRVLWIRNEQRLPRRIDFFGSNDVKRMHLLSRNYCSRHARQQIISITEEVADYDNTSAHSDSSVER